MSAAIKLSPAETARLRQRIEDAVERLIALMDILDPDPDLEEEHDLEAVSEDEGAQCDDEGFVEATGDGPAFDGPPPWRQ